MSDQKIRVIVRKRPVNSRERQQGDTDILSQRSVKTIIVREEKVKVDLTKYIEEHHFTYDRVFTEETSNQALYEECVQPLISAACQGAKVTCFAYGQTGSGKTFTMMGESSVPGLYVLASQDLFNYQNSFPSVCIYVSFYEIYCGKLHDLLNDRNLLFAREDSRQNVNIVGLKRYQVSSVQELMDVIQYGLNERTTGQTGANDDSSRSHAVLEINLRENRKSIGKMSFIDLAGSERGADVNNSDKQTRMDSAEINKSLLALKECIRALDQDKKHTPFRGSKLTQVLKDSFIGNCRTVMIANVSPCLSSCEHTLNTLRYSDRVKELGKTEGKSDSSNVMMLPRQQNNAVRYYERKPSEDEIEETRVPDSRIPQSRIPQSKIPEFSSKIPQSYSKVPEPYSKKPEISNDLTEQKVPRVQSPRKTISLEAMPVEHEKLIQVILAEEEDLISAHRKMIDGMVELVKHQMEILAIVDKPGSDINEYADQLEGVLDMKEEMVESLRNQLKTFQDHLREEEEMSNAMVEEEWLI